MVVRGGTWWYVVVRGDTWWYVLMYPPYINDRFRSFEEEDKTELNFTLFPLSQNTAYKNRCCISQRVNKLITDLRLCLYDRTTVAWSPPTYLALVLQEVPLECAY